MEATLPMSDLVEREPWTHPSMPARFAHLKRWQSMSSLHRSSSGIGPSLWNMSPFMQWKLKGTLPYQDPDLTKKENYLVWASEVSSTLDFLLDRRIPETCRETFVDFLNPYNSRNKQREKDREKELVEENARMALIYQKYLLSITERRRRIKAIRKARRAIRKARKWKKGK